MDVTPLVKDGAQIIQSYAGGRFRVSGDLYESAIIVSAEDTVPWGGVSTFDVLGAADFQPLIDDASNIDVVLMGTGAQMQFLPAPLKKTLREQGLSIDVMDTGAACRTYNVLMAEGRRVTAILLPV